MKYKVNLTDEEEILFLQVVGTRLEHIQKSISDMEEDVQTANMKKLQDEFKTHESVLMKFLYGEKLDSGFSRYVNNKTKSPIKEFLLSSGFRFNGSIDDKEQYLKNVSDDNDIQLCVYLNNERCIYKVYIEDVYQEDIKTLEDLKYILNKLSIRFS